MRNERQIRAMPCDYQARDENGEKYIEAYFAVFDSVYEIWPGATESVHRDAFDETLQEDDIRCLIDHDTRLVLGRNRAGTFELRTDAHGLWGRVKINPQDQDALNLYARVQRGDVSQCSFGFEILDEETEYREDGTVHWTIKKVRMYEGSICTFPAYKETLAQARAEERRQIEERKAQAFREKIMRRLKKHGA